MSLISFERFDKLVVAATVQQSIFCDALVMSLAGAVNAVHTNAAVVPGATPVPIHGNAVAGCGAGSIDTAQCNTVLEIGGC